MSFALVYARQELRRRWARALFTALGLAAGVSLVVGIIGVSQGLDDAQGRVLSPLRSVGTDILVTRVAGSNGTGSGSSSAAPAAGGFFGGGQSLQNAQDNAALAQDNSNIVTDLAKLGKPGDKFTHDFFFPATLLTFPVSTTQTIAGLPGVASVSGGLSLLATHQTGTVPSIVARFQTGGQTVTQTVRPAPLTPAEQEAVKSCIEAHGGFPKPILVAPGGGTRGFGPEPSASPAPSASPTPSPSPTAHATRPADQTQAQAPPPGPDGFAALEQCLPQRFQQYVATFVTPQQTLEQVVNPPQTDITSTSYSAAGVDPSHPDMGLITRAQVTDGRFLHPGASDEVLLNVAYAGKNKLHTGSTLAINGTTYHVVGLVSPTLTGNTADVYFPLATLQTLSNKPERVNMVLVKATDAGSVDALAQRISQVLPQAQVVTTKSLADQVTGSLNDAKSLADRLGGAVAVIVLVGAFLIAILLTLAAIAKRVREIGTLRAIGWRRGMVVRQILLETVVIGAVGGVLGVLLGLGVDAAVSHLSPELTANNAAVLGQASSSLAKDFGISAAQTAAAGVTHVRIEPPLHAVVLAIGVAFALVGGLLAGAVGGWRAARLAPAVALRDLG